MGRPTGRGAAPLVRVAGAGGLRRTQRSPVLVLGLGLLLVGLLLRVALKESGGGEGESAAAEVPRQAQQHKPREEAAKARLASACAGLMRAR